jgi:hypothetical protein
MPQPVSKRELPSQVIGRPDPVVETEIGYAPYFGQGHAPSSIERGADGHNFERPEALAELDVTLLGDGLILEKNHRMLVECGLDFPECILIDVSGEIDTIQARKEQGVELMQRKTRCRRSS